MSSYTFQTCKGEAAAGEARGGEVVSEVRGGDGQRGPGRGGPAERAAGQQVAGDIDAEAGAEGARRAPQEGTGRKFNWAHRLGRSQKI